MTRIVVEEGFGRMRLTRRYSAARDLGASGAAGAARAAGNVIHGLVSGLYCYDPTVEGCSAGTEGVLVGR